MVAYSACIVLGGLLRSLHVKSSNCILLFIKTDDVETTSVKRSCNKSTVEVDNDQVLLNADSYQQTCSMSQTTPNITSKSILCNIIDQL